MYLLPRYLKEKSKNALCLFFFFFPVLGYWGFYKEILFILKGSCIQKQIRAFLWRLWFTTVLGQQWLTAVVPSCNSCCSPVDALFKCQHRVDTHSLVEGDKIDGGWSKSPGLMSLHCPCSKLGEQAPVQYCMCMDFDCGFYLVDFLQIFIKDSD